MGSVVNNIYFKSNKNVNELVIRAGQKDFNEINVIISNADRNKKIPQLNPFLVQAFVKKAVNRHENIDNMKYTRQGKIMLTTRVPICAVQLLSLNKFMEIDVTTNIIAFSFAMLSSCFFQALEFFASLQLLSVLICKCFMSFVQWNCRSLNNKKIWLHQPPFSTANFWIFQETFLKADDNLSHLNKNFFRTHRSNRFGGSLLIGIPKNISGRVIYSIENDPNLEVLAVEIHSKNLNFIIINIYAPHGFNIASIKRFLDSLSIPIFIFGDFNLHHPLWGGNSQSSLSESFVDWLNNSDFSMLNTSAPTPDQISRTISAHTSNKILVDKDYPPWWNAACHNFSHLKKLAWNKARRNIATTEWIKYKKYRSKFKFHFKKAKENYWDNISKISRNPRMFFKILTKLSSHTNPNVKNHEIIFHNNRYETNPMKKSNLFANHFSSYSHEVQPIPLDYSTENEFLIKNIEFWELKRAISKTKTPLQVQITYHQSGSKNLMMLPF
ncbi:hypothetical protein AVEN_161096-1 [Araneus ventricosus]|uniref:Endonuclease/exonuclease/phosphatase domain-containing protein n=1 Tax=Araneus ventricosus TaxID=182803 RepID=A0A4Y2P645_ARAVE|nr:hypothetical protein AVEN_161096-1 [Araneus ventricosus]